MIDKVSQVTDEHSQPSDEVSTLTDEHSQLSDEHSHVTGEHSHVTGEHSHVTDAHSQLTDQHSQVIGEDLQQADRYSATSGKVSSLLAANLTKTVSDAIRTFKQLLITDLSFSALSACFAV